MKVLLVLILTYLYTASAFLRSLSSFQKCSKGYIGKKALHVATEDIHSSMETYERDYAEPELSSSTKQFDWNKQWYPLAVDGLTDRSKAHALMFLGNNVVLWHDKEKWNVFEDACPHRGVPLSEGRVESNGELLCSYHAWTFNGVGECTSIPQTLNKEKEASLLPKACAQVYPVQERQGLIWVWGSKGAPGSDEAIEAALKTPHVIDERENPLLKDRLVPAPWNFRNLPHGWDFLMENGFDPAHVPVSHHKLQGNRYKDVRPIVMKRIESLTEIPTHLGGKMIPGFEEDAGFKYLINFLRNGKVDEEMTIELRPPSFLEVHFKGRNTKLILYATPTKPGFCRLFLTNVFLKDEVTKKNPKGTWLFTSLPTWMRHMFTAKFLVLYRYF